MALTWADTYKPVVYQWFRTGMDSIPSLIPVLFDVRMSDAASEYALGVGGVPTDQFDVYEDAGRVANVDVDRYYPTTFTHVEKPIRFTLKRKDVDDDQMGLVQEALDQLGLAAAMKREQDGASVFVNSFDSNFVGADSVALCSASHPYGPDNTGETQGNTGTAALSYDSIKSARSAMRGWVDSQKNPLPRMGTMMLIPPELEDTAMEITRAELKPGTADNDASATQGFNYMVWDYLTNAKDWWMLDMNYTRRFLRWYNRKNLEMEIVEQTTTHVIYEFYMRYSYGWVDWRFAYGNDVA